MTNLKYAFALLILCIANMAFAKDPLSQNMAMFPDAKVPPPIPVAGADGKLMIPGWSKTDRSDAFYKPEDGSKGGFLQIIRKNDGYNIDSFFDHLISESELTKVKRPTGQEAESFKTVFGPMVAAVFGDAKFESEPMSFFADLHGPDAEDKVIGTLIFAPPDVFESWDAVLLPLVWNGYVDDPAMFDNRDVMKAGTNAEKTAFYIGMIDTKVTAEFGTLSMLSEGAMQAVRNATTISGCAGVSNCTLTYDSAGNAEAEFDVPQ